MAIFQLGWKACNFYGGNSVRCIMRCKRFNPTASSNATDSPQKAIDVKYYVVTITDDRNHHTLEDSPNVER